LNPDPIRIRIRNIGLAALLVVDGFSLLLKVATTAAQNGKVWRIVAGGIRGSMELIKEAGCPQSQKSKRMKM